MPNLFDDYSTTAPNEVFTELLSHPRARIERIVSYGQATPEDTPYDQDSLARRASGRRTLIALAGSTQVVEGQFSILRELLPGVGTTALTRAHQASDLACLALSLVQVANRAL